MNEANADRIEKLGHSIGELTHEMRQIQRVLESDFDIQIGTSSGAEVAWVGAGDLRDRILNSVFMSKLGTFDLYMDELAELGVNIGRDEHDTL